MAGTALPSIRIKRKYMTGHNLAHIAMTVYQPTAVHTCIYGCVTIYIYTTLL